MKGSWRLFQAVLYIWAWETAMRVALLACVLGICSNVYGALPSIVNGRVNEKEAAAHCMLKADDTQLQLHFSLSFNGNDADRFMALAGPKFERNLQNITNEVLCSRSGTVGRNGIVRVESMVNIGGVSGVNPCGARQVIVGSTLVGYEWYFMAREYYREQVYTDIDRTYRVACFFDNANRDYVTANIGVYRDGDVSGDTVQIPHYNTLSILSDNSLVRVDDYVRLMLQTQVVQNRGMSDHYGSYGYHCDYKYDQNQVQEGTIFLLDNGCPATGNIFGLTQGLQYVNDNNFLYKSQTPLFVLASEAPPNNLIVISCYVQYCDGNKGGNPRCTDYCAYSRSVGRKRRSIDNANSDRVSLTIRLHDREEKPSGADKHKTNDSSALKGTTLIAIVAVVVFVFLALVVLAAVCVKFFVCSNHDDTSSTDGSTKNLPKHLQPVHLQPAKF